MITEKSAGRFTVKVGENGTKDHGNIHGVLLGIRPGSNPHVPIEEFNISVDDLRDLIHVAKQIIRISERG